MPSARLLAITYKQLADGRWKWIPWKLRTSEEFMDNKIMERPRKVPKLDQLLGYDEFPEREINSNGMGRAQVLELMELHNTSVALCRGAHLHSLKEFTRRFMKYAYARHPEGSGLRPPNIQELLLADKALWGSVFQLINEEAFSMDAALHEVAVIRNEMASVLQPRPFVPKPPTPNNAWRRDDRKGKGDKGNGKGKGGKSQPKGAGKGFEVGGLRIAAFYRKGQEKGCCVVIIPAMRASVEVRAVLITFAQCGCQTARFACSLTPQASTNRRPIDLAGVWLKVRMCVRTSSSQMSPFLLLIVVRTSCSKMMMSFRLPPI